MQEIETIPDVFQFEIAASNSIIFIVSIFVGCLLGFAFWMMLK